LMEILKQSLSETKKSKAAQPAAVEEETVMANERPKGRSRKAR